MRMLLTRALREESVTWMRLLKRLGPELDEAIDIEDPEVDVGGNGCYFKGNPFMSAISGVDLAVGQRSDSIEDVISSSKAIGRTGTDQASKSRR